jgi:hypothetical protein
MDSVRFAACFTAIDEQGGIHLSTEKAGSKPNAKNRFKRQKNKNVRK